MAESSRIAWTRSTFNPWIGCSKVGPGCDHCYAEAQDARGRWDGGAKHWGPGVPRYRTSAAYWKQPLAWNKKAAASGRPWRVFCASLADVFDNEVPRTWRYDLWRLIEATPNLSWLLVTKRVGNVVGMIPVNWEKRFPNNVRLLITVCTQAEADRDIPKLLALPCKNGISYEPALGPVDVSEYLSIDGCHTIGKEKFPILCISPTCGRKIEWIIIGGESAQGGAKARPFDLAWARSTIAQCKAVGVPIFVKQLGAEPWLYVPLPSRLNHIKDRAGADPAEWPEDLRCQEFPA